MSFKERYKSVKVRISNWILQLFPPEPIVKKGELVLIDTGTGLVLKDELVKTKFEAEPEEDMPMMMDLMRELMETETEPKESEPKKEPVIETFNEFLKSKTSVKEKTMAFDGTLIKRLRDAVKASEGKLTRQERRLARQLMIEGVRGGLSAADAKINAAIGVAEEFGDTERDWDTFFTTLLKFLEGLMPIILQLMEIFSKMQA